jgi:hypothetical protein
MLTVADEAKLKNIVNQSTIDDTTKLVLIRVIDALAVMAPAAADQTVGLATDDFVGTTEHVTIKNGIITAIATN